MFRQDRENRPKGGLITLVRNSIPAAETQSSGQADLDTEFLGVKLVLQDKPVTVLNVYSPPDKQIQLEPIPVDTHCWIITGDVNSHSPSWGYQDLNRKGEEVENWTISNQYGAHAWRISIPPLAWATNTEASLNLPQMILRNRSPGSSSKAHWG